MVFPLDVYLRIPRGKLLQHFRIGITNSVKGTQLGKITHKVFAPVSTQPMAAMFRSMAYSISQAFKIKALFLSFLFIEKSPDINQNRIIIRYLP